MGVTWNPFIDNLDFTGSGGTPELISDPVSPAAYSSWVLVSGGTPMGLLLALTQGDLKYQFSYRTTEGTTVRATLS